MGPFVSFWGILGAAFQSLKSPLKVHKDPKGFKKPSKSPKLEVVRRSVAKIRVVRRRGAAKIRGGQKKKCRQN